MGKNRSSSLSSDCCVAARWVNPRLFAAAGIGGGVASFCCSVVDDEDPPRPSDRSVDCAFSENPVPGAAFAVKCSPPAADIAAPDPSFAGVDAIFSRKTPGLLSLPAAAPLPPAATVCDRFKLFDDPCPPGCSRMSSSRSSISSSGDMGPCVTSPKIVLLLIPGVPLAFPPAAPPPPPPRFVILLVFIPRKVDCSVSTVFCSSSFRESSSLRVSFARASSSSSCSSSAVGGRSPKGRNESRASRASAPPNPPSFFFCLWFIWGGFVCVEDRRIQIEAGHASRSGCRTRAAP
mmetsp:Transcript_1392/g.3231  ORF Transcript_1392/g.3231 Transcript_1392/m.3231 type:complete len:291 (+) Transcript_1392:4070-4942(+)